MKLRLIEFNESCKVCGCGAVEERITYEPDGDTEKEVNYRKFACGGEIKSGKSNLFPDVVTVCPKKAALDLKKAKRKAARESIAMFCDGLDVDEDFKTSMRCALNYQGLF